jgi:hypothetical protein
MKNILYIIAFAITLTFSSCSTETSFYDTLDASQADQLFGGSLGDIENLIGEDAYNKFSGILGIPIYAGNNPPVLNGEYNIFEMLQTADAINPNDPFNNTLLEGIYIKIALGNQNNQTLKIDYVGEFWLSGADGIDGTSDDEFSFSEAAIGEIFISGNASADGTGGFNVYVEVIVDNDPTDLDTIAISGFKTADGIQNLTYAYVSFNIDSTIDAGTTWTDNDGFSPSL